MSNYLDELKTMTPATLRKEVQRLRGELSRATTLLEQANAEPIPFDYNEMPRGMYSLTYTNRGSELTPLKGRPVIVDDDGEWYEFNLDQHQYGVIVRTRDALGFFPQVSAFHLNGIAIAPLAALAKAAIGTQLPRLRTFCPIASLSTALRTVPARSTPHRAS